MKKLLEKDIEGAVCRWARANGWLVRKYVSVNQRSVPDRIFMKNGRTLFVEFKAPGKMVTRLQAREHRLMMEHEVRVEVIDNIDEGIWLLESSE